MDILMFMIELETENDIDAILHLEIIYMNTLQKSSDTRKDQLPSYEILKLMPIIDRSYSTYRWDPS